MIQTNDGIMMQMMSSRGHQYVCQVPLFYVVRGPELGRNSWVN